MGTHALQHLIRYLLVMDDGAYVNTQPVTILVDIEGAWDAGSIRLVIFGGI